MVDLRKLQGKPQIGVVKAPDGEEVTAAFCLADEDTYIELHATSHSQFSEFSRDSLLLQMSDGTFLTFADNVRDGTTDYPGTGRSTVRYFPHYVFVGSTGLESDYRLSSINFSVDDAKAIFYDFDAFSIALHRQDELKAILVEDKEKIGRTVEWGERPIIAYFTGKLQILAADTELGLVTVNHRPSYGLGSPDGVAIKNEIFIRLDLIQPTQITGAIGSLMQLLRFLQVIAGRQPKITSLNMKLEGAAESDWLEVVWCLAWTRQRDGRRPRARDMPINGGVEPTVFSAMLASWLRNEESRRVARARFAETFAQGNQYTSERLVSAANMFDLLASECLKSPDAVPADIARARDAAIQLFEKLPQSDLKRQALGDLGRLGKRNLKSKILQRSEKLMAAAPGKYSHINEVITKSVDARNYYVHGTPVGVKRVKFFREMMTFHTDVLEFVFGATELLDAGWDYGAWASHGTSMSHPFGEFAANYKLRIGEYMSKLEELGKPST